MLDFTTGKVTIPKNRVPEFLEMLVNGVKVNPESHNESCSEFCLNDKKYGFHINGGE